MKIIQELIELENKGYISNLKWNIDFANGSIDLYYNVIEPRNYIYINFVANNSNILFSEVIDGKI